MIWRPPVPRQVTDPAGTVWSVRRAWPGTSAGSYDLEVWKPDRPGVLAGQFSEGCFHPVSVNDRGLPALAAESGKGEVVVHRVHKRAVLRTPDAYIKVYRPGRAAAAGIRHSIAAAPLTVGGFRIPRLMTTGPDVLVFSRLAGRSFFDLGQDHAAVTDAAYAARWADWRRAWTEAVAIAGSSEFRSDLERVPLHEAGKEAAILQRWVDHWLLHSEGIAEAAPARAVLLARMEAVTAGLLGSPPDAIGWAHGDLHDKQVLSQDHSCSPGLLDFDESCRAEAALDLANLDVHLELRWQQHRLTTRRYTLAHAAVLSAARRLQVTPQRFAAYAASTRLRLACLYSFRPLWGQLAATYLMSLMPGQPQQAGTGA
jgi:hypothetical protein